MFVAVAGGFIILLVVLVALDLGVLSRRPRVITPFEAAASTALWVLTAVGVGLALAIALRKGWIGPPFPAAQPDYHASWLQYITAYLVEFALNLDNIAVLAVLFAHFRVPHAARNRVLFWILLACLVERALLIWVGAALLALPWIHLVFAGILALASLRTLVMPDQKRSGPRGLLAPLVRQLPTWTGHEHGLFTRVDGRLRVTPLVRVVLVAAATDLTFALDSVPAAFAVTLDPMVALAANTLAVLALRSIYFWLAHSLARLRYLKVALVVILVGLAVKMVLGRYDQPATVATMIGILLVGGVGVGASLLIAHRARERRPTPLEDVTDAVLTTRRNLRKVVVLIVGTCVVIFAIAIGPLPGPGFLIIAPLGLAILATEFIWARRLLNQLKAQTAQFNKRTESIASKSSPWLIPLVIGVYAAAVVVIAEYGPFARGTVWLCAMGGFLPIAWWSWKILARWRSTDSGHPRDSDEP